MTADWPFSRTSRMTIGPRALLLLGLLLIAAMVLAACDNDSNDDLASDIAAGPSEQSEDDQQSDSGENPSGSNEDASNDSPPLGAGDPLLDFFQCLRDGGLDVADPEPGDLISLEGIDPNDPSQVATVDACRDMHLAEFDGRMSVGQGQMGENRASPEALLAFVDCMREDGIDMPDPDADGTVYLPEDFDPDDRGFQAAGQRCAQHLDGGIMISQPGAGGGMVTR